MDITFDKIVEANKKMNLTPISGKDYAQVNQRVKAFRFLYPEGTIETEILSCVDGVCVFKAIARDDCGKILATGTSYEKEGAGFINKTSYIENCETSAVGRCLGFLGLGIDASIASFEEVKIAKEKQSEEDKAKKNSAKKSEDQNNDPQKMSDWEAIQKFAEIANRNEKDEAMDLAKAKARVLAYINKNNIQDEDIQKICKAYKVDSIQNMSLQHCQHYINYVSKKGGEI